MRILIMANNIDELGGAQRVVHQLAAGLGGRGHEVTAIGVVPHAPVHDYPHGDYRRVTLLDRRYPKGDRSALESLATRRLQSILDDGEPGVVITAQLWSMEHLARCRQGDWRVIGQFHSSYEAAAAGRDLTRALRVYREVDAFALLTDADARAFAANGFQNTVVMPNALPFRPDHVAAPDSRVVTYLGRLAPEKGPRFLVEAWHRIAHRHPAWRLQFVGSGPLAGDIARSAADADLRMTVQPPTGDPMGVLLGTGVLALPSLTEGLPLTLAEAMACGVPVVAADCSAGVRALVDDGVDGLIARRGDSVHLAEQLDRVLADGALRRSLGAAGREKVAGLDESHILDRWEELLADVLR